MTDNAVSFEAVKIAMKQDKNGHILTLAIHPDEIPESLFKAPVGQRYGVALCPLDEELDAKADEQKAVKVFRLFGAKCRDPHFQQWVLAQKWAASRRVVEGPVEEQVRDAIKTAIRVDSSTAVRDNPAARERFLALVSAYDQASNHPNPGRPDR